MDLVKHSNIVLLGFCVWLAIAPRTRSPQFSELFLAYMVALLFSLIATSEMILTKPIAFFFSVGGALAFCFVVARSAVRITIRK